VVFENASGIVVVNDDRTDRLPAYDRVTVAAARNRPNGFWVASTAPEAAAEAVTGDVRTDGLRRLLVCSDGVSRLVDFFGRSWADVFELIEGYRPRAAIDLVRAYEVRHPDRLARPGRRVKQHDDATLAVRLG
jgi:hypothetical protein